MEGLAYVLLPALLLIFNVLYDSISRKIVIVFKQVFFSTTLKWHTLIVLISSIKDIVYKFGVFMIVWGQPLD